MNEGQLIADGERVAAFLEDDAIKRAFAEIEKDAIAEIRGAKAFAQTEGAWARLTTLDALQAALRRLVDRGVYAARQREVQERSQRAGTRPSR